ncbi:hypothetical protein MMC28_008546 [Mycoblastus sanguinarius]|nr:hypothetical protein [Mycoblastus sanguinarius]
MAEHSKANRRSSTAPGQHRTQTDSYYGIEQRIRKARRPMDISWTIGVEGQDV